MLIYLVGKAKREEHENPHLVAGSPEAFFVEDASQLARVFERRSASSLRFDVSVPESNADRRVELARHGINPDRLN